MGGQTRERVCMKEREKDRTRKKKRERERQREKCMWKDNTKDNLCESESSIYTHILTFTRAHIHTPTHLLPALANDISNHFRHIWCNHRADISLYYLVHHCLYV